MFDVVNQAVAGVVPPQTGEAIIRERWRSLDSHPRAATLARKLICSIVLAPLGWLVLAPFFVLKILPFLAKRYTLTNRRLMVCRGMQSKPIREVPLADIDDVRVLRDANSDFYRAGTMEVFSQGHIVLTLPGVPEPESFRNGILQASRAWVPNKSAGLAFVPAKQTTEAAGT